MISRQLYKALNLDLRFSRIEKKYFLSEEFEWLHKKFIETQDSRKFFKLEREIKVKRADQLLLNLQYNNLVNSYHIFSFQDYRNYMEEFFTYFLNYELTTGYCSPLFPNNIKEIFYIVNTYYL